MNNTISYWNLTGEKTHYPRLDKSISTDVLIIGGGITGITCAYCLAEKGLKPVLIEAGALADGTTGNTTGKMSIQHGIIYYKTREKYNLNTARDYALSQSSALDFVKNVVERESIECQLAENNACIFGVNDEKWDTLEREYNTAKKIGIKAELYSLYYHTKKLCRFYVESVVLEYILSIWNPTKGLHCAEQLLDVAAKN
jgi:L-2-hydroxyglutarate oxidase LhgO